MSRLSYTSSIFGEASRLVLKVFFRSISIEGGEANIKQRRNRDHFHTFAFDDKEEEPLQRALEITGEELTDTSSKTLANFVPVTESHRENKEEQSWWDFLKEHFRTQD